MKNIIKKVLLFFILLFFLSACSSFKGNNNARYEKRYFSSCFINKNEISVIEEIQNSVNTGGNSYRLNDVTYNLLKVDFNGNSELLSTISIPELTNSNFPYWPYLISFESNSACDRFAILTKVYSDNQYNYYLDVFDEHANRKRTILSKKPIRAEFGPDGASIAISYESGGFTIYDLQGNMLYDNSVGKCFIWKTDTEGFYLNSNSKLALFNVSSKQEVEIWNINLIPLQYNQNNNILYSVSGNILTEYNLASQISSHVTLNFSSDEYKITDISQDGQRIILSYAKESDIPGSIANGIYEVFLIKKETNSLLKLKSYTTIYD